MRNGDGTPVESISFRDLVLACLPAIPRADSGETTILLEIGTKLGCAEVGSTVTISDAAYETFTKAVSRLSVDGAVLINLLPLMHAAMLARDA